MSDVIAITIPPVETKQFCGRPFLAFDGDTIRCSISMRIYGIDAPEEGQPYFMQSREALTLFLKMEELTSWRKTRFSLKGIDDYGRLIVVITIETPKGTVDVGQWMVERGHAWARGAYAAEQVQAQLKRRGLWKLKKPVPPWEYRKSDKFKSIQGEWINGSNSSPNK